MLSSMTAFARAETNQNDLQVAVEVRSYNSKHLDLSLRMTSAWLVLEERVKRMISERISRGRIEINLQVSDRSEEALSFDVDEIKAAAYHTVLLRLKETLGLSGDIPLNIVEDTLLRRLQIKYSKRMGFSQERRNKRPHNPTTTYHQNSHV